MSEELLQTKIEPLGRYFYVRLGATTLRQLKKEKLLSLPNNLPKSILDKKPDGLIFLPGGAVKAVIEYKLPEELASQSQIDKAIKQELEVAKALCNLLIVSDGQKSFWVNPHTEEIVQKDGVPLNHVLNVSKIVNQQLTLEEKIDLENLIDQADFSLTSENNALYEPEVLDPTPLAKEVWQKIWISTGKDPEKCLYNFVEVFVFKFLSDIGVLNETNNFQNIYSRKEAAGNAAALSNYANISRRDIIAKFPPGEDGTTLINGTIFVNENGEPNFSQANLFGQVLDSFQRFDNQFGSFKYVTKEFKTRLFETFLRQSAGVKSLGQYFTPRNVVQAIVKMANIGAMAPNVKICDPFCGVGGFLLEALASNDHLLNQFIPVNGVVNPNVKLVGFDKGTDEKDDERTIVLAKANMLIYLSDILARYHSDQHLESFSNNAFNSVFKLIRTNLGTFGKVSEDPCDLIITNPPYVTSGSSSLKDNIDNDEQIKFHKFTKGEDYYSFGGRGTESLAINWIINNLKSGGLAYVVVPDGLLLQEKVLEQIKAHCYIEGIISLPTRTFYSTPKKTYILIIKKKEIVNGLPVGTQNYPVFTYLVSEVGETRDSKRFAIEENDLNECVELYLVFANTKRKIIDSPRQKIIDFNDFEQMDHWLIDRLWSDEEKTDLGIIEETNILSENEFYSLLDDLKQFLNSVEEENDEVAETHEV